MSLGRRIRELRQSRGLTQAQLGAPTFSKSFVSLIETDRARPSVQTLAYLARKLGSSADALLGGEDHLPETAAGSLLDLARDAIRRRSYDYATRLLDFVPYLADTHGLQEARRETLLLRGRLAFERRDYEASWAALAEARMASEQSEDPLRTGRALALMGWIKLRRRELPEAADLLKRSLATLRQARAGRDPARLEALIALGTTLVYLGDFSPALRRFEEVLESDVARHNLLIRGRAQWGMGLAHRRMGRLGQAAAYLRKAKDTFEKAEELPDLMRVLHNLGQVLYESGEAEDALRYFTRALLVMEELHMEVARAATLTEIARVHYAQRQFPQAERYAAEAAVAAEHRDAVELAEARLLLGQIKLATKRPAAAIGPLEQALATFQARQMQPKILEAARTLGNAYMAQNEPGAAANYLSLALSIADSAATSPQRVPADESVD